MHNLTVEETRALETVTTFDELADVALATLVRMKGDHAEIVQICGPMSTGGCGKLHENMERFSRAVDVAVRHGISVFNQVHFQEQMIRICNWKEGTPYPMELLEVFYGKVLSSGHITKGLFLPDWESSVGARWEREFLLNRGLAVEEYPTEWLEEVG